MSEVNLLVGGRTYKLACQDGEEDHIRKLAGMIDERMQALGDNLSKIENKDLLFAALFLADELDAAKQRSTPPTGSAASTGAIADELEALAAKIEKTADSLESARNNA